MLQGIVSAVVGQRLTYSLVAQLYCRCTDELGGKCIFCLEGCVVQRRLFQERFYGEAN